MIDGDGYYSASIIYKYLKYINPNVQIEPLFHINRIHGLKDKDIMDKILQDKPSLLICPDSASADFEQCKILKDNGIDVLILDHHPTNIDNNYAVVINNKLSPNVINQAGSGALVTWKFCKYLDQRLGLNYAPQLIDLVYFSLLSDICDMNTLENRAFAYWGSRNIRNKLLIAMCDELLKGKDITNHNISWYVQPKISDIIRCQDENIKHDLFYALAEERQDCIDRVVEQYSTIHNYRKKYVQKYFESMDSVNEDNKIIFEKVDGLYPYYTGLVGSKINNKYNKPCILYREPKDGKIIGSVRSPYPIKHQLIDSGVFDWANGHNEALGCQFDVKNIDKVKEFVKNIDLDNSIEVTQSFTPSKIPKYLFNEFIDYEELFGQGIKKPQFHIHNIHINSKDIRVMGKNRTTIKFSCHGIDYIKFFVPHDDQDSVYYIGENKDLNIELIGEFTINEWNGRITPQVLIDKIEVDLKAKKPMSIDDIF